jgi:DNA-binding FadR family transcriptional regulator
MPVRQQPDKVGFPVGGGATLLETIAGRMIRLVMQGYYKRGDRLPSELELARQFNVGRGTIREVLKALSVVGLVRVERGKGTYVADRSDFLVGPISLGFEAEVQLSSLIDARRLIEVELAGLAAERAGPSAIRSMQENLESMQKHAGPRAYGEFLKADLGFHFAVANATGNMLLVQFLTLIRNLMTQWISQTSSLPGVAEKAIDQHRLVFEAIQNHQPEEARGAMARHLESMARHLLKVRRRRKSPSAA